MYNTTMVDLYREFVLERHKVYLARQRGEEQPWTTDPVISKVKFTNMFRVLDPGSQFVLTDLWTEDDRDFLARCFLYRYTNLPATWRYLKEKNGRYPLADDMDGDLVSDIWEYRDAGNTVFSGAYIIMPAPGVVGGDKVKDAVALTNLFVQEHLADFFYAPCQADRFLVLRRAHGVGRFMAMQILTDWTYGQPVDHSDGFIIAGPGAIRGARALNPSRTPEEVIRDMCLMLGKEESLELNGTPLSLMDVQNTLCEFSKYVRELERPRKVNPYRPSHPGQQPAPVLPRWAN